MAARASNVAMDLYRRRLFWRLRRRISRPVVGKAAMTPMARHRICNQLETRDAHGPSVAWVV